MVVVKLIGGLGNQMFQYALGRRLAYIHNERLKLDISEFEKYTLRQYGLNHFNINADLVAKKELINTSAYDIVREQHFHFDAVVLNVPNHAYLIGYWQSEKYFKDIEDVIRQEFTVKMLPTGLNEQILEKISGENAVSLHIRRGDYVNNQVTNKYHGILPLAYYQQAMHLISQYVEKPHFYIFSDDVKWAMNNITADYPLYFVTHNDATYDYEDLRLMSACKHNIIANSSFSWWGAWLNTYPGKMVIAPQRWFNICPHDTKDLIPPQWVTIKF